MYSQGKMAHGGQGKRNRPRDLVAGGRGDWLDDEMS
jgi:hypothetical protein